MSTPRERAQQHAAKATTTRELSEPFDAPWMGADDKPEQVAVRELGAEARLELMSNMDVDVKTQSGKINMNSVLPYVTDLLVEPGTAQPVFEAADHDWLVETYPALVNKIVITAIGISNIGEAADKATLGN